MNPLLKASAICYCAIGAAGLLMPGRVPAAFGGEAATPDARTEVRAVYGGIPMAIAGLVMTRPRQSAMPAATLSAGMALGRLTGISLEKESSRATRFFLGVEVALALALLAGSRRPDNGPLGGSAGSPDVLQRIVGYSAFNVTRC